MFAKFAKFRGVEEKWQEDLKKVWNTVFTFGVDLDGDYPWSKAETNETESSGSEADDHETASETTDEQ